MRSRSEDWRQPEELASEEPAQEESRHRPSMALIKAIQKKI